MAHRILDNPNSEGYKAILAIWELVEDFSDDHRTKLELLASALSSYIINTVPDDVDLDDLERIFTKMFESMKEATLSGIKENQSKIKAKK